MIGHCYPTTESERRMTTQSVHAWLRRRRTRQANRVDAAGYAQAEAQIRRTLYSYCRALDRRDYALLRSVFWPDAVIRTGTMDSERDDFLRRIDDVFRGVGSTHHLVGNVLVEVDDANAWAESYLQAYHRLSTDCRPDFDLFVGARYQDRFERRSGIWRVAERRMVFDWFRECDDSCDWEKGNSMGLRSPGTTVGSPGIGPWADFEQRFTPR